jgi:hypothetical protein
VQNRLIALCHSTTVRLEPKFSMPTKTAMPSYLPSVIPLTYRGLMLQSKCHNKVPCRYMVHQILYSHILLQPPTSPGAIYSCAVHLEPDSVAYVSVDQNHHPHTTSSESIHCKAVVVMARVIASARHHLPICLFLFRHTLICVILLMSDHSGP